MNIKLSFPLRGIWKVFPIPGHPKHARDFVGLSDSLKYMRKNKWHNIIKGGSIEDWYGWGSPIYAPISGKIIQAKDGWEDKTDVGFLNDFVQYFLLRKSPSPVTDDPRSVAGNFVTIESPEGFIVFMCHMKKNSIRVAPGTLIKEGEKIGEVGNSGNSLSPHLHLNVFHDIDSALTGHSLLRYLNADHLLPFTFSNILTLTKNKDWIEINNQELEIGSTIKDRI